MSSGSVLGDQHIDPSSDRAVYRQIADHIRAAITRGHLSQGDQLPSEAQLMNHYGVARMTVRNALRVLQEEGLIASEHGRGVYVRPRPPVRRLASDRFDGLLLVESISDRWNWYQPTGHRGKFVWAEISAR